MRPAKCTGRPGIWTWLRVPEMTGAEMHEILMVRQTVFILEQRCFYGDIDVLDLTAHHLVRRDAAGCLTAYCRVMEPGTHYAEPTVGRVLVASEARGGGLAKELMAEAHRYCQTRFGTPMVRLNAQAHLRKFYESLGYKAVRGPYDEDGIPHIEMLR